MLSSKTLSPDLLGVDNLTRGEFSTARLPSGVRWDSSLMMLSELCIMMALYMTAVERL